ncbi:hypothetical protein Bbelb_387370 [Branchiostoma belcheri]|nr:hypothetical protein Bbelb_387370 [Branchiostoma belcheri]
MNTCESSRGMQREGATGVSTGTISPGDGIMTKPSLLQGAADGRYSSGLVEDTEPRGFFSKAARDKFRSDLVQSPDSGDQNQKGAGSQIRQVAELEESSVKEVTSKPPVPASVPSREESRCRGFPDDPGGSQETAPHTWHAWTYLSHPVALPLPLTTHLPMRTNSVDVMRVQSCVLECGEGACLQYGDAETVSAARGNKPLPKQDRA